jgi:hypothetical protein
VQRAYGEPTGSDSIEAGGKWVGLNLLDGPKPSGSRVFQAGHFGFYYPKFPLSTISFCHPVELPYFPIGEIGFPRPDFAVFPHDFPLVLPASAAPPGAEIVSG